MHQVERVITAYPSEVQTAPVEGECHRIRAGLLQHDLLSKKLFCHRCLLSPFLNVRDDIHERNGHEGSIAINSLSRHRRNLSMFKVVRKWERACTIGRTSH